MAVGLRASVAKATKRCREESEVAVAPTEPKGAEFRYGALAPTEVDCLYIK
jgi:hypothetical protein